MTVNTRTTNGGQAHTLVAAGTTFIMQNKGPGNVTWSRSPDAGLAGVGIVLGVNDSFEFVVAPGTDIYVTADVDATDLRVERTS